MRTSLLMAVAVLVGGCQSDMPVQHFEDAKSDIPGSKCKGQDNDSDCKILVNIERSDSGCTVKVLDTQYTVGFKKGSGDKSIWWRIDSAPPGEYRFTADGITPKSTTIGWADNFKSPKLSEGGREFRWKNKNDPHQAGREYAYDIKVINEAGVKCQQDPIIKNQT